MKLQWNRLFYGFLTLAGLLVPSASLRAAGPAVETVPVRMTVSASVASDKRMPQINQEDVLVRRGKEDLQITEWVPARGSRAGLELFILIDDSSDARLGLQLDDLRKFIMDQPSTTSVGVGYMRNASVEIAQNLTTDHAQAANALRLPFGSPGAYGSPYLSVADLIKRWPASENRHEVVMVTDGMDRAYRTFLHRRRLNINPDVETAARVAQKTGTVVYTVYAPAAGYARPNYWRATSGQMDMARLSDATGGNSYFLGLHHPVSFAPYLDDIQKLLDNQYLASVAVTPGKKAGLQYVKVSTEVAGVELSAHDAVWVSATK